MCDDWLRLQPGMLRSLLRGGADRAILLARRLSMASKFTFIANSEPPLPKFPSVIHIVDRIYIGLVVKPSHEPIQTRTLDDHSR